MGTCHGLLKTRILDESFNCALVLVVIKSANLEGKALLRAPEEGVHYSLFLSRQMFKKF